MSLEFGSDNQAGVHAEIMQALIDANVEGFAASYSEDKITELMRKDLSALFEREVYSVSVSTGTAANCLLLSQLCRSRVPCIYMTDTAHPMEDESTAVPFFTGALVRGCGHRKLDLNALSHEVRQRKNGGVHAAVGSVISIAQPTEYGELYSFEEVKQIATFAHEQGMKFHMDGARLANALMVLGCSPADATWRLGVDALSFGCSKGGAMNADAAIIFDKSDAEGFLSLLKRSGHLVSKSRYLAAQVRAFIANSLWLKLAEEANARASELSAALSGQSKVEVAVPVETNQVFLKMSKEYAEKLWAKGVGFYLWDEDRCLYRFVVSWKTTKEAISGLVAAIEDL